MARGAKRKRAPKGASTSEPAEDQKNVPDESPSEPAKETNAEEQSKNDNPETSKNDKPESSQNDKPESSKKAAGKGTRKRAKVAKPETKTEYFSEKRNLEDLWEKAFPVGTEWDQLDSVYRSKWSFTNLEEAFEEGGDLHNKKVYLFGCTEPQLLHFEGQSKVTLIPVVVAVVSPFPPSDKIGIKSVQRETEEIVPMKQMKMGWEPYIPLENRGTQVERLKNSQIFILSCTQRRAGLKHLKEERVKKFEYCLPYFYNPLQEDEIEQSTVVQMLYPGDPPVHCEFDWEFDELEEFADKYIEEEVLPADQKEPFKDFVKEKVREAKKANREAREARKKAQEEMSNEARAAFENMKFYKFYPVSTPDTPDISAVKAPFINRYYGKAYKVI